MRPGSRYSSVLPGRVLASGIALPCLDGIISYPNEEFFFFLSRGDDSFGTYIIENSASQFQIRIQQEACLFFRIICL